MPATEQLPETRADSFIVMDEYRNKMRERHGEDETKNHLYACQFVLPWGIKRPLHSDMTQFPEAVDAANYIEKRGYHITAEVLTTGRVVFCLSPNTPTDDDQPDYDLIFFDNNSSLVPKISEWLLQNANKLRMEN